MRRICHHYHTNSIPLPLAVTHKHQQHHHQHQHNCDHHPTTTIMTTTTITPSGLPAPPPSLPPHYHHSHPHHYSNHPQKGTEAQECLILTRFTVAMSAIDISASQALGHPCKPSTFPSSPPHPNPYVLLPHSLGGCSKILASCLAERPCLFISPNRSWREVPEGKWLAEQRRLR